jgi:hypothetical protein
VAGDPERVWIGVGAWLYAKRPEGAVAQLRLAREAGAGGDALFSWDAIADTPGLRAALVAEASSVITPPATTAVEIEGEEASVAPAAATAAEGPGGP